MAKSLNKVQLIGNLTRDPELRYTPTGTAVASFSIATNRSWTTDTGEKKEEVDFHRIVAWAKLAEICSQYLGKGAKAYVEGRLANRSWTAQDGQQKTTTEIVIDDMIILSPKKSTLQTEEATAEEKNPVKTKTVAKPTEDKTQSSEQQPAKTNILPDDIPF